MKRVREASDATLKVHNPPPTPEMEEFAVKQEFKNEVDINQIIARHERGIQPPSWMTANTPRWGDFTDAPATFQEAFQLVQEAQNAFMSLPLAMRKELDHDPRNLDHADREMYEKYGLLKRPAEGVGTPATDPAATQRSGDRDLQDAPKEPKKPKAAPAAQKPPSGDQND